MSLCRMSSRWWELDKASSWLILIGEASERQEYGVLGWDTDLRNELAICLHNPPLNWRVSTWLCV